MALSNTTILWIVELALYLILAPATLYLSFRHGKHGALGFFYLQVFAVLRIVSDIIFIAQRNDTTYSESAAIVSSVGLSPLILALAGFIHEEHVYLVKATHSPALPAAQTPLLTAPCAPKYDAFTSVHGNTFGPHACSATAVMQACRTQFVNHL